MQEKREDLTNLLKWRVFDPQEPARILATVTFIEGCPGDTGFVTIDAINEEVKDFLIYYLDDPLDGHPVYIHGLGSKKGPYSNDPELFIAAMYVISHHFPSWDACPEVVI